MLRLMRSSGSLKGRRKFDAGKRQLFLVSSKTRFDEFRRTLRASGLPVLTTDTPLLAKDDDTAVENELELVRKSITESLISGSALAPGYSRNRAGR